MDRAGVSVIIPSLNRRSVIGRAIRSSILQTVQPLEVLVVDDCSSDDTCEVVESLAAGDSRIALIRLDRHRGAAAARNAGILAARGKLLAFLDSDDEWTPSHLERKIRLLEDSRAALVFGSFYQHDGRKQIEVHCAALQQDPLEYLFLTGGGFRTSTFVCERERISQVMFDEELHKHQDWDLLINLARRFPVAADTQPTAILHIGGVDRLSARPNHGASVRFFQKNRRFCSRNGWILFATVMLERNFRAEGKGREFRHYLEFIRDIDPDAAAPIRSLTSLLHVPRIGGRLFRAACRRYCMATAQRRPGLLEPGSMKDA